MLRRLVPSAYRPVLANRVFRRLILGFAVSYLGDGMSFVAVAWLAIQLAPGAHTGLWVGGAVAAYTLPGVVGALLLGRRLRRVSAQRLLLADNLLRAVFIGAVPLLWVLDALTPTGYVVLLAVSSLLHAWGSAATSETAPCAGSRSAPSASPTRPTSWRPRPPTPASPTTSAAPSPR